MNLDIGSTTAVKNVGSETMTETCYGKVKLTKKDRQEGMEDSCHAYGSEHCEDCGKTYCHHHINRDKHKCDDSVKGTHSIWKESKAINTDHCRKCGKEKIKDGFSRCDECVEDD
jgi:hypothetical protein